ncbi:MAG: PAS domain S-box protein [candidate division Zixibacteria bacterium]|nr:PAS domain S-box protein [candidate division Zixibacteria bacterium]
MSSGRILVVEDEAVVAKDIANSLERLGYTVVGATTSGEDALKLAERFRPDLVLMDIKLQGQLSGIETADRLRTVFDIPAVFLTAYADDDTLRRARITEPYGYILKPFELRELHSTIEIALYRHSAEKKLRESEERYRTLQNNLPVGVFRVTPAGEIISVNPALLHIFGAETESQILNMRVEQLYQRPDNRPIHLQQLLHNGKALFLEEEMRRLDGETRWVHIQVSVFNDSDGNPQYFDGIVQDITERRRTAMALRESERKLSTLMSNLPGMVYRCLNDEHWTMEFISEGCRNLTGYRRNELLGNRVKSYNEIIYPDDREMVRNHIDHELKQGQPFQLEYRINTASGGIKWVWEQGVGIFADNGALEALEGFITDITERVLAERALQEREATLRGILTAAPIGIGRIDPERKFEWINESMITMVGYQEDELIGRNSRMLYLGDADYKRIADAVPRKIGRYWSASVETRWQRKDGKIIDVLLSGAAKDVDDFSIGMVFTAVDITDRKRAERALRASEARLMQIVQGSSVASFVIDRNHIITHWNKALENLTGHTAEQMIGTKNQWAAFYRERRPVLADMIIDGAPDDVIDHQYHGKSKRHTLIEGFEVEDFFPDVGDGGRWLYVTAAPLTDDDGAIIGAVETLQDVTLRRKAEDELQEKHQALEEKNIALRSVLHHLEDEKREFRAGIARKIDQVLMPALSRLVKVNGKVDAPQYDMIAEGLRGLALSSGGILHLYSKLSPRETEICNLIRSGASSPEIAKRLGITVGTVKKHREIVRNKFGISSKNIKLAEFLRSL